MAPKDSPLPSGSFPSVTSIPHVEPGSSATMGHSVVSGKTAQHHHLHRPLLQHHWSTWALRINQSQRRHTNIISHVKLEKSSTFHSVICLIPIRQVTRKKTYWNIEEKLCCVSLQVYERKNYLESHRRTLLCTVTNLQEVKDWILKPSRILRTLILLLKRLRTVSELGLSLRNGSADSEFLKLDTERKP